MTESHEIDCCRPREGDIGSEDLRHHRAGESVCLSVCVFLCSRLRVRQLCGWGISGEEEQGELEDAWYGNQKNTGLHFSVVDATAR